MFSVLKPPILLKQNWGFVLYNVAILYVRGTTENSSFFCFFTFEEEKWIRIF